MTAVTWMIPVLNGMPFLPYTLESIEKQSCRDWRVVVWDNGSTDGTLEELRKWIPSRLPGEIVTNRALPLGLARAAMVAGCESEFGALVDSDDINHPDRLEKQLAFMSAHREVAVVGTQLRRIDVLGQDHGVFTHYPLNHDQILQEMLVTNPIGQPSVLFRRSAALGVGNYRDVKVEDYDLWLRMAARGCRLANLPEALVNYRVHEKSTTQKQLAGNLLEGYMMEHLVGAAPLLFGCDALTMRQLRGRKHPHAIVPLRRIAKHLDAANIWKSPVFYHAARQMIADGDARSRIIAAVKNRGVVGGLSEAKALGGHLVRSLKSRVVNVKSR